MRIRVPLEETLRLQQELERMGFRGKTQRCVLAAILLIKYSPRRKDPLRPQQ